MEILDFLYMRNAWNPWRLACLSSAMILAASLLCCAAPQRRPVEAATEIQESDGVYHIVRPGQTLWRIARAYGVSVEELATVNGIGNPARVAAGRPLFVPGVTEVLNIPAHPAPPPPVPGREGTPSEWQWPVARGEILSYFGAPRKNHRHMGIDIDGQRGQKVLAARAGRISYSGNTMRGYGRTVVIDHGDGFHSLYAHNARLLVAAGQRVDRGQPIALVGRTGNASTEHCHFEIRRDAVPVDPLPYLLPPQERGE
jgi:murein DD-endopeptidase MepM/ murein hydrolase activator NlpD